jgi:hypothetical protein
MLALNITADVPTGTASSVVLTLPGTKDRIYPGAFPLAGGGALVLEYPGLPASDSPVTMTVRAFDASNCLVANASKQVTIKGGVKTAVDILLAKSTAACADGGISTTTADGGGVALDGSGAGSDGAPTPVDGTGNTETEVGAVAVDGAMADAPATDSTKDVPPAISPEAGNADGPDAINPARAEVADAPLTSETGTDVPLGSGGASGTGGSFGSGGSTSTTGGTVGTGGIATGGGGNTGTGGNGASGGGTSRDGGSDAPASTGGSGTGGATGVGGQPGSGGTTTPVTGPCDIYQMASTPCVAAHSTVRALYGAYSGALYQIRRASDGTTQNVPVLAAGGFVDISVQDLFCSGTTCTISILYDQSPNHNDLSKSPKATWLPNLYIVAFTLLRIRSTASSTFSLKPNALNRK